tara:strand:- start:9878 stop:10234 length:357 start_codon:yes stop_codon:yes gene_type:complete
MKLRTSKTENDFDNCNIEFGIEFAITGSPSAAANAITKLKPFSRNQNYECSSNQFLIDFAIGYHDAGSLGYKREMPRLPLICGGCGNQDHCYDKGEKAVRKKEPIVQHIGSSDMSNVL